MVAALPAACNALNTIKLAKSLLNASATFAIKYTANVPMNVILRPRASLSGPQKDGAIPCTTMYTVTVNDTRERLAPVP